MKFTTFPRSQRSSLLFESSSTSVEARISAVQKGLKGRRRLFSSVARPKFCQRRTWSRFRRVCVSLMTIVNHSISFMVLCMKKRRHQKYLHAQRKSCLAKLQNIGPLIGDCGMGTGEQPVRLLSDAEYRGRAVRCAFHAFPGAFISSYMHRMATAAKVSVCRPPSTSRVSSYPPRAIACFRQRIAWW